jgi:hypothetical protein
MITNVSAKPQRPSIAQPINSLIIIGPHLALFR